MAQLPSRRTFLQGAIGAAAAGPFVITRPGWSQTRPIRIGVLAPMKTDGQGHKTILGPFAAERINQAGGVLGRHVEFVYADHEFNPEVGVQRAKELLLGEKVDVLEFMTGSHVMKAVAPLAYQYRKVFFTTNSKARELTGEAFVPTTFRCCLNTDQNAGMLATYFARLAPKKPTKFFLLNQDYT